MKQLTETPAIETSSPLSICQTCNSTFKTIQELNIHTTSCQVTVTPINELYECDECDYRDSSEENVCNHKIAVHTKHICNSCEFVTESVATLISHLQENHTNSTLNNKDFNCRKCPKVFNTQAELHMHIKIHNTQNNFPCDYCGFKANSLHFLDVHLKSFHKIHEQRSNNNSKSRLNNQYDANMQHSARTTNYTSRERIQNGPCRQYNNGVCRFESACKYAHIRICKFQESCYSPTNCRFYHNNKSNINFLSVTHRQQPFQYRAQDFPPL